MEQIGQTTRISNREVIVGSLFIALAQLLFGTNDALIKYTNYPQSQVLFVGCIFQLFFSLTWWKCRSNKTKHNNWYGDQPHTFNIWLRGFFYFLTVAATVVAIYRLPLGDYITIFFVSPLFTIFIARIYLKEALPSLYLLIPSILLTVCGIILSSQPTFVRNIVNPDEHNESLDAIGIIAAFTSAFCWTLTCILVRTAKESHFLQIELVNGTQSISIWIPFFILVNNLFVHDTQFYSHWLFNLKSIFILCMIGIMRFASLACSVIGYQQADATKVSWLEYILIPVAMLYQTLIFYDIPNTYEICGALMVTIGSMLPVLHECYKTIKLGNIRYQEVQLTESTDMD